VAAGVQDADQPAVDRVADRNPHAGERQVPVEVVLAAANLGGVPGFGYGADGVGSHAGLIEAETGNTVGTVQAPVERHAVRPSPQEAVLVVA